MPQLEQALDWCLDALRARRAADRGDAQAGVEPGAALHLAGVDLPLEEFDVVVRILAPRTEGLGLEQAMVSFRYDDGSGGAAAGTDAAAVPAAGRRAHRAVTDPPAGRCASSTPTRRT